MNDLTPGQQATIDVIRDKAEELAQDHAGGCSLSDMKTLVDKGVVKRWRGILFVNLSTIGVRHGVDDRDLRMKFINCVFGTEYKSSSEMNWTQVQALALATNTESLKLDLQAVLETLK